MKKTIVTVALVLIFVLALAAPAFAQNMTHSGVVKANGVIVSNKIVGHLCNTGMEQWKSIRGTGELTNDFNITMVKGKATVVDNNDFVSAAGTTAPLTITSTITLCTPAKYTYTDKTGALGITAPVDIKALYPLGTDKFMPAYYDVNGVLKGTTVALEAAKTDDRGAFKALTTQTWAAQVRADAGYSGKLHQNFEAAYGPYTGTQLAAGATLATTSRDFAWSSTWGQARGGLYVGDYFKMGQTARTSMGQVSRYIDISSPWSGALLYEDSTITGFAEVVENFSMTNIAAGSEVPGKWWQNLFVKR